MQVNVIIDDQLLAEALKLSKLKSKNELIKTALKEFIHKRKRLNLQDLRGKTQFREDYDYKGMRR